MQFTKMEGLGNDFVVVAGPLEISPEDVRRWCDRRRGVGGDGVLELSPVDRATVRMRYWNADGSVAEMCGNGLRCVAKLAFNTALVDHPTFEVDTHVGRLPVEVLEDGNVRVLLGTAKTGEAHVIEDLDFASVDIGNPHAITFVEDVDSADVHGVGARVETDANYPEGTNVEFASIVAPDRIRLRVWERGVGETQACGTGAAATAFLALSIGKTSATTTVELPGGDLVVDTDAHGTWITGAASIVFHGELSE